MFSSDGAPVVDAFARGVYRYTSHVELMDTWTKHLFAPLTDAGHAYFLAIHAPTVSAHVNETIHTALANVPHKIWWSDTEPNQWARTLVVLDHFFHDRTLDVVFVTRPDLALKIQPLPFWNYTNRNVATFPFLEDVDEEEWLCDTMIIVPRHVLPPFYEAVGLIAARRDDPMAAHRYLRGALEERNVSVRYMVEQHYTCGTGGMTTTTNPLYAMHGRDQRLMHVTFALVALTLAGMAYCVFTSLTVKRCYRRCYRQCYPLSYARFQANVIHPGPRSPRQHVGNETSKC